MTMRGSRRPVVIAGVALALVLVAVVGYFAVVRPQRSESARLATEIDATEAKLNEYRALRRQGVEPLRIAELFRLTKAMPDDVDMPGVLLDLTRIADDTGIMLESVTPQTDSALTGYRRVPIELVFRGNFYDLSDFLYRLRNLVTVERGELSAAGRLFSVASLEFTEGVDDFPQLQAKVNVDAFVYGADAGAGSGATPPAATGTTPSTPAAPATPSGGSATAAGATS